MFSLLENQRQLPLVAGGLARRDALEGHMSTIFPPPNWEHGDSYFVFTGKDADRWVVRWLWYGGDWMFAEWTFDAEADSDAFADDLLKDGFWPLDGEAGYISDEEVARYGFYER